MDSFGLREENAKLSKEYEQLKHMLIVGENRVKELHEEELRYLLEIPQYKQQAKDAKEQAQGFISSLAPLKKEIEELNKDLRIITGLNYVESKCLTELKETQKKIIQETKEINETIKQRHEQLKQRELAVADKEKACELREVGYSNRDFELTKGEVDLAQKVVVHKKNEEELRDKIETHKNNVEIHNKNVSSLIEQKKFHAEDAEALKDRLQKADKLVKDQIKLKTALLLQAEKADEAIKAAENKQKILDRALDDLKNQENILKIKELRVKKLINDNNIQKELAELSK